MKPSSRGVIEDHRAHQGPEHLPCGLAKLPLLHESRLVSFVPCLATMWHVVRGMECEEKVGVGSGRKMARVPLMGRLPTRTPTHSGSLVARRESSPCTGWRCSQVRE